MLPAIPWSFRFQRPQHLAREIALTGRPVLYVDAFRRSRFQPVTRVMRADGSLLVLRLRIPGAEDLYHGISSSAGLEVARTIVGGVTVPPSVLVVQHPGWASAALELKRSWGVPMIYDLIDFHQGFPGAPSGLSDLEEEILEAADAVTASSRILADQARRWTPRVEVIRNAVVPEDFVSAFPPGAPAERDRPVVGYVGALTSWFDHQTVEVLARSEPDWVIRLVGKVESPAVARLGTLPNVELLGEIPYDEVAGFLATVMAVIIPFEQTPLTRAVDPVKLYEALAAGLPVVATRIPEVARWSEPLVYLADSPEGFLEQLRRALAEDSFLNRELRRDEVHGHTWRLRAEQLLRLASELR